MRYIFIFISYHTENDMNIVIYGYEMKQYEISSIFEILTGPNNSTTVDWTSCDLIKSLAQKILLLFMFAFYALLYWKYDVCFTFKFKMTKETIIRWIPIPKI